MFMFGWYIDPLYLVIFFVTIIISLAAQLFISSQYRKWSKVRNGSDLTGAEVGNAIVNRTNLGGGHAPSVEAESSQLRQLAGLRDQGILTDEEYLAKRSQLQARGRLANDTSVNTSNIVFERVAGQMSDHYDPRNNTVRMSADVAQKPSVAAMAIVAHELGHAQQHERGSLLIKMRNVLLPAVRVSPQIAYLLIFIGLIFNVTGAFQLGIFFFGLVVLFSILTLPVEFDASRRGLKLLEQSGLMVSQQDRVGSRRVLTAAASTYVAAAITAILQLFYYISIGRRR
jgi:Zn-dependent membrane protease YugP